MPPYIDRQAVAELQKQDLAHWNNTRNTKGRLGAALLLAIGFILGCSTHFSIAPIASPSFTRGTILSFIVVLMFLIFYSKIVWRMATKTMIKSDFDLLLKYDFFEMHNQRKVVVVTLGIISSVAFVFGMQTAMWLISLSIALLGLTLAFYWIIGRIVHAQNF